MRQINQITVRDKRIARPVTFAIVADLHNGDYADVLPALQTCDAILIVGDLVDRHANTCNVALRFLQDAPQIAPTFYAIGNHEREFKRLAEYWPQVERANVTVLDDTFTAFQGVTLGALSSRINPENAFLAEMAKQPGFKLLMCHHPEYFKRHIAPFGIDLTVSGHAHGGQVRIGRQGVYSPDQWLFPRLTSGFYFGGRLLVSRGMTNATWAPRINCPCELILLHLKGEEPA